MPTVNVSHLTHLTHKESLHQLHTPIVLIHGWGCDSKIWEPLHPILKHWANIIVTDINYDDSPIDQVAKTIVKQLPEQFIVCGWSLGGMLATHIAAHYMERVRALITLSSNVTFTAKEHWPNAMELKAFETFYTLFKNDPQRGLKRFAALQTLGDKQSRQQNQWLQQCFKHFTASTQSLQHGLHWLGNIDNMATIQATTVPALYVFGENDVLVPKSAAQAIQPYCNTQQTTAILPKCGHLLHYPTEDISPLLTSFFSRLTHLKDS